MTAANVDKLVHIADLRREGRSQHELRIVGDNHVRRQSSALEERTAARHQGRMQEGVIGAHL